VVDGELAQTLDGVLTESTVVDCGDDGPGLHLGTSELDPLDGVVWRVKILRSHRCDFVLISLHHFAVDGASVSEITNNFWRLYARPKEALQKLPIENYVSSVKEINRRAARFGIPEKLPASYSVKDALRRFLSRSRGASQTDGASGVQLSTEEVEALEAVARSAGVSLSSVLLFAFGVLLLRVSESTSITIGMPVSLRDGTADTLIGPFFNTVPVRLDLQSGGAKITDAIADVAAAVWAAIEYRDVPLDRLIAGSVVGSAQLFDALYVFDYSVEADSIDVPEEVEMEAANSEFAITLAVQHKDTALSLRWDLGPGTDYDQTLISEVYREILSLLSLSPQSTVYSMLATKLERLEERRPTKERQTVLDYFLQTVAERPDEVAIVGCYRRLSYRELHQIVKSLASALQTRGVGPGDYVLVNLPRDELLPAALVAVLWVGAAYIPIDSSWPESRVVAVAAEVQPSIALGQFSNTLDVRRLTIDDLVGERSPQSVPEPHNANPDGVAYMIYTSGSSGEPKGVMVQHRAVNHLAQASRNYLATSGALPPDSVYGWTASIAFDASVEGLAQLCLGTALCVIPRDLLLDTDRLWPLLEEAKVTLFDCTPSIIRTLLADPSFRRIQPMSLLIGGESIDTRLWAEIQAYCNEGGTEAFNMYGPTEACVTCAISPIVGVERPSIGFPTGETVFEVLTEEGGFADEGDAVGELLIGGPSLALGYFGRDPHAEHAFIERGGQRFYKTGDVVRMRSNEGYEFLGRRDEQVKLHGYRIELEEIRGALAACDGVIASGVALQSLGGRPHRLVAAVFSPDSSELDVSVRSIRQGLTELLPAYMIPDEIRVIRDMNLGSSDKMNTRQVLSYFNDAVNVALGSPAEGKEALLRRIWEEVLGTTEIFGSSHFRQIGGRSLQLTLLRALIMKHFQVKLEYAELAGAGTFDEQLELIDQSTNQCESPISTIRHEAFPTHHSIEQNIQRLMEDHKVEVCSVSSIRRGCSMHFGFNAAGNPVDPRTRYRLTCIEKLLHAAVLLRAQQEGQIDLFEDLRPEIPQLASARHAITLHDCLRFSTDFDNTVLPMYALSQGEGDTNDALSLLAKTQGKFSRKFARYGDEGSLIVDALLQLRGLPSVRETLEETLSTMRLDMSGPIFGPGADALSVLSSRWEEHYLAMSSINLAQLLDHIFLSGQYLTGSTVESYFAKSLMIPSPTAYERATYGGFITSDYITFASDGIVNNNFIAIRPSTKEVLCVHASASGAARFIDSVARLFGLKYLRDDALAIPNVRQGSYEACIGQVKVSKERGQLVVRLQYRDGVKGEQEFEGELIWDGGGSFVTSAARGCNEVHAFNFFEFDGIYYVRMKHWVFRLVEDGEIT
jgi:amino acid adenylation domain-containing protein